MTLIASPQQARSPPRVHDDPWPDGRAGLAIIVTFFGLLGGWAALSPLDAGVYAAGVVKVSGNRTTIQHRDGGVVAAVFVREGDRVEANEVLVDLSATELLANERALAGQALELEALRARLQTEASQAQTIAKPARWASLDPSDQAVASSILMREDIERGARDQALIAQAQVLDQRVEQLKARIEGYKGQILSLDRQARLTQDQLKGLRELASRGYAATNKVRDMERGEAEIERQRAEMTSAIAEAEQAIGEVQMQAIAMRQDRAQQIAGDVRLSEAQLAEILPKLQAARAQLERARVRAPVAGKIVDLAFFNSGAVVRPGERILDIVPDHQPLIIEAQIRPSDADDVREGMTTTVRLSAIEARNLVSAQGKVTEISADRLHDERTGQWYFTASIEVTPEELARVAEASDRPGVSLSAGMPVEVVVPLRKRTALQYLLEPLNQALWRSFREH